MCVCVCMCVRVLPYIGYAVNTHSIESRPVWLDMYPRTGSVEGNTLLTLTGNGFVNGGYIKVGRDLCLLESATLTTIICRTPPSDQGRQYVHMKMFSTNMRSKVFYYTKQATPEVTNVVPDIGTQGQTIVVSGIGFDEDSTVSIGQSECIIKNRSLITNHSITCETTEHKADRVYVKVNVPSKGDAKTSAMFRYVYHIDSIDPNQG